MPASTSASRGTAGVPEHYERLFETLPMGVVYQGATGEIIAANQAAADVLGVDLDVMLGRDSSAVEWQAVRADGSPFPGEEHPAMVALRTGRTVSDVVMGVAHGRTGERRWLSITAVPDVVDEHGVAQRVYTFFADVTDQVAAEDALAESDRMLTTLRNSNTLAIVSASEDEILDANDVMLTMLGYTREEYDAHPFSWREITPPEWGPADAAGLEEMRRTGICRPFEKEYFHRDGHRVPVLIGAAVIRNDPLRWITYIVDLSAQRRAEAERVEAASREQAATVAAATARSQVDFLLRISELLAYTRNRDELLRRSLQLVVTGLGDWSYVFTPRPDGGLGTEVLAHRDPRRESELASFSTHVLPPDSPLAATEAFRTGTTQLVKDVRTERRLGLPDLPPGLLESDFRPGSMVAAPLTTAERCLGVLGVVRGVDREPFTEDDAALIGDLARQLALGLRNAELSQHEHTVAETLQRAVLPTELPHLPGLDLASVYLPATEGVSVGGDFHDAFVLGPGRIGLVVGDVVGHDVEAASVMGQLRNALRAIAALNPDPAAVLTETQSAVMRLLPEALATVFYAVLDVRTGDLAYASAGHPPPAVVTPSGVSFLDGATGVMLGATIDSAFHAGHLHLDPGSSLVMFTDGLVEDRSRDYDLGIGELRDALALPRERDAAATCHLLTSALLGSRTRSDDVCILVARLTGTD